MASIPQVRVEKCIMTIKLARLLFLLALSTASGFCQVSITVKLDQSEYLVGEPIFVIVDATNIGAEALGYSTGDGHADLTVPGGQHKQAPLLRGCYTGVGSGSGGGIFHPPLIPPGQTVSFRYLLKGYRLRSGAYVLRANGKAGVRWFFGAGRNSSPVSERKVGDPVEGATFDVSLSLSIREGTEDELRQRYVRYVNIAVSESGMSVPSREAREAIAEMAPPFLEKTILEFANQPETAALAVEGLGQIPTPASREDLVRLYDKSADLTLRAAIVEKLAGIATLAELPFFASLLPGRSSKLDDRIRVPAVLGIGRLGGEDAVKALQSAPASPNPEVRQTVALALGNTRSPAAVPILIEMYSDEPVRNDVCGALATLTHYQWCDGGGSVTETQAKWKEWWGSHASRLRLYGIDECAALATLLPLVN
jgi:hypothetical protein